MPCAPHHSRRTGQRVGFTASGLSVTEARGVETFGRHLDELLDARILEHVLLRGRRFEDHVEREQLGLGSIGSADRL